jgi:hypothetical protein
LPTKAMLFLTIAVLVVSVATLYKLNQVQQQTSTPKQTTADVRLQAVGGRVCLSKEVEGIPVQYYCERMEGESAEDFGRRCRREFAEFCKGFETQ